MKGKSMQLHMERILPLLRQRRQRQNEFCARAGLHEARFSRIVNGGYFNPTLSTLERMAGGLDMTVIELLELVTDKEKRNKK
jgi:transcriptional regulator with XRE-family HTH domain